MAIQLDHMILPVNDMKASVAFYVDIVGFAHDGDRGPFALVRVGPDFMLQLAPWGTTGGVHLAFSMKLSEFDRIFQRLRDAAVPYGDRYDLVGNMKGPGDEEGSRGMGKALYFFDPNQHCLLYTSPSPRDRG